MEFINPARLSLTVALLGLALGAVFGAVGRRTHFCALGAVSDIVAMGDWNRMRMWLLAIAVAMLGANGLELAGVVDLFKSIYRNPSLPWLSHIVGGGMFGAGMVLGSGCGSKSLIRAGAGNLKSWVVLAFLAISAYATLKGWPAVWRAAYLDPLALPLAAHGIAGQDVPSLLAHFTGVERFGLQAGVSLAIAGGLLFLVLHRRKFRSFGVLLGGTTVGLLVAAGWWVTGYWGYGENPETLEMVFFGTNSRGPESLTLVAPVAYTLEWWILGSDKSLHLTFGIGVTLGIVLGSFCDAMASRSFRWEGFASPADTARHIIGGILMGVGGVLALGCTIGQGITGLSTLALGSFIAFFAIVAGAVATLKIEYWKISRAA